MIDIAYILVGIHQVSDVVCETPTIVWSDDSERMFSYT